MRELENTSEFPAVKKKPDSKKSDNKKKSIDNNHLLEGNKPDSNPGNNQAGNLNGNNSSNANNNISINIGETKSGNKKMIILGICSALIIAAVAGALFYYFMSDTVKINMGYNLLDSGDLQGAINKFDEVIAKDSKNISAYAGKASAQIKQGDESGAHDTTKTMFISWGEPTDGGADSNSTGTADNGNNSASSNNAGSVSNNTNNGGNNKDNNKSNVTDGSNASYSELIRFLFVWICKYNIALDRGEENEIIMDAIDFNGINATYNVYTRPDPPVANPDSGKYDKPIVLKLSTNQTGTICYIVGNKKIKLKESTIYEEPIYIKKNNSLTYISAAVYDELLIPSNTVHFQYELNRVPLSPPGFSHSSGSYKSAINLELSNPNEDGKIYYTTNGDEPTTSSKVYSGKISIGEGTTTVKAKIIDSASDISSETIAMTYNVTIPKPTPKPENPNDRCPKCGSKNITLVGNRNNPTNQIARCLECGYGWDSGTKTDENNSSSNTDTSESKKYVSGIEGPSCTKCGGRTINPANTNSFLCTKCGWYCKIHNTTGTGSYQDVSGTTFIFTDNRDAVKDIEN